MTGPELLGFPLAALIGISLGLLGGGGSILTVPILVYVLGFDPKRAIAMGLAVVGVTSLIGAAGHFRKGNVLLKEALVFAAIGTVGTFGGAKLSTFVSGQVQLALFGVVMLLAAVFMNRNSRKEAASVANSAAGTAGPTRAHPGVLVVAALTVGLLTGLAGVGGGFLIVPALVLLGGMPMKQAVGSSLLVISINSFVGFGSHLGHVDVPWAYLTAFTAVATLGIVGGTWASHYVSQASLKRAFSGFLVLMSVFVLYKNREVVLGPAPSPTPAMQPSPQH